MGQDGAGDAPALDHSGGNRGGQRLLPVMQKPQPRVRFSLCYHTRAHTRVHTIRSIKHPNPRLHLLLLKAPLIYRGSKQLGVYKV